MIWKNSKKFGIGYYTKIEKENENENIGHEKNCYIALYYPVGNQPNEYKQNELKTTSNINVVKKKVNKGKKGNEEKNEDKVNKKKERTQI